MLARRGYHSHSRRREKGLVRKLFNPAIFDEKGKWRKKERLPHKLRGREEVVRHLRSRGKRRDDHMGKSPVFLLRGEKYGDIFGETAFVLERVL